MKYFKWAGAKTTAAHFIGPAVAEQLENRDSLLIPFAGSLGIVKWLHENGHLKSKQVIANDLNRYVIAAWECARSEELEREVVERLNVVKAGWEAADNEGKYNMYYLARDQVRDDIEAPEIVQDAVRFHFLIRAGFNGLWRESKKGQNVPIGKKPNGSYNKLPDWEKVFEAGAWIRDVDIKFANQTFSDFFDGNYNPSAENIVVYNDPPYHHSKLQYVKQPFKSDLQQALIDELEMLNSYGAAVVYSNSESVIDDFIFCESWDLRRIVTKTTIRAKKKTEMKECLGVLV